MPFQRQKKWNLTTSHKWKRFHLKKYSCLGILKISSLHVRTCTRKRSWKCRQKNFKQWKILNEPKILSGLEIFFSIFQRFAAANKSQYFLFLLPSHTPSLYTCRPKQSFINGREVSCEWNEQMCHFDSERQVQKNYFTRSKRRRKSERW